jgi:hypothetical protein
MYKSKILMGLVLIVYVLSVLFQFGNDSSIANSLKSFIIPIFTLLYFVTVKKKSLFFLLFLVLYAVSDLLLFIAPYISNKVNYYMGNSLYILAYTFLLLEVCKSVCVLYVLKNYKIHLLVLTILNIYIIYVLHVIVAPYVAKTNEFYVELVYNIVMLLVLSLTLVNYFYRDNVKSLYLFLGAMCIVFSEVIWIAYGYISASTFLNIVSTSLYMLSFYFFYIQSKLVYEEREEEVEILIN